MGARSCCSPSHPWSRINLLIRLRPARQVEQKQTRQNGRASTTLTRRQVTLGRSAADHLHTHARSHSTPSSTSALFGPGCFPSFSTTSITVPAIQLRAPHEQHRGEGTRGNHVANRSHATTVCVNADTYETTCATCPSCRPPLLIYPREEQCIYLHSTRQVGRVAAQLARHVFTARRPDAG